MSKFSLKIEEVAEKSEEYLQLQEEMIRDLAESEAVKERRKQAILGETGQLLSKGTPVHITEEMRELDIALQVAELIQKADYYYRLNRFLIDADDDL
jgi:hypothetical protein